jgi:hypothetical protein
MTEALGNEASKAAAARSQAEMVAMLVQAVVVISLVMFGLAILFSTSDYVGPLLLRVSALAHWLASGLILIVIWSLAATHQREKQAKAGDGIIGRFYRASGLAHLPDDAPAEGKKSTAAGFYECDKGAVRGFVTKQSFFLAVAALLLRFVQEKIQVPMFTIEWWLYAASFAGLVATVFTALVSLHCYTTFLRFVWKYPERFELLQKGRDLDERSFYLLVFSFLSALTAYQPVIALPATGLLAYVLPYYYFFEPE